MNYQHLSPFERYQISFLLNTKKSLREIAKELNRSASTISRELKRNVGARGYRPKQANERAQSRQANSRNARMISADTWSACIDYLKLQWSPEQIASQLGICHESIYRFIYANKRQGGDLYKHLRITKKNRKRYAGGRERRGQIPNRRSIHERPPEVESRTDFGHWEADTIVGAQHQQAIVTLVERSSGLGLMGKVEHKTAQAVSDMIIQLLQPLKDFVDTITYDNGKEFAQHERINRALSCESYFADPFASWQRGSNENFNGLVRQYIPKKRLLSTVTQQEVKIIEDKLNHRPRKRLGFKSPIQVMQDYLFTVALRS